MVFCFNRPCALYAVPWPQQAQQGEAAAAAEGGDAAAAAANGSSGVAPAVCLTPSLPSAFSPRIGPQAAGAAAAAQQQQRQQQLVFLSQAAAVASGVHSATAALHSVSWQVRPGREGRPEGQALQLHDSALSSTPAPLALPAL